MTPRERVQAAFRFEETDIVPYWITTDGAVNEQLKAYYGADDWRDRLVDHMTGRHAVGGGGSEDLGDGLTRDPFGYVSRTGKVMHLEEPALKGPTLDGYEWPEAESLGDWDALAASYAASPAYRLCGMGFGFFDQ